MIGNFVVRAGSTVPWLEVGITKDGVIPLNDNSKPVSNDPNCPNDLNPFVDLTGATIQFQMVKCGRVPTAVSLTGTAESFKLGDQDKFASQARFKWGVNDTMTPGLYYGTFVITFEDNSVLKWPLQSEALCIEIM